MTATEYITGLREFADWLEANSEALETLDGFSRFETNVSLGGFYVTAPDKASFAERVRMLGRGEKRYVDVDLHVERAFGPIKVVVYTARENVCRKVVTGTREVTSTVRDPELLEQVPLVEVTETVEDVEWVCPQSIFAGAQVEETVAS